MSKTLFTEKQKFRQIWLLIIIIGISGVMVWGFVQQIIFGIPFGNKPAPDWMMYLLVLVPLAIFGFFFSLTLHTRIDQNGVAFRFFPIHRKDRLIKWDSLKKVYVRKYKPIAEYGGWGFRRGRSGLAYNTSGNMGLQLELEDGKKILLGTRKPDELRRTLEKLEKSKPEN
jgi:hypothetical protein